jgi:hypothetical protein
MVKIESAETPLVSLLMYHTLEAFYIARCWEGI